MIIQIWEKNKTYHILSVIKKSTLREEWISEFKGTSKNSFLSRNKDNE